MTSSLNIGGKNFFEDVTRKQIFKMMMSGMFYFSNSYRLQIINYRQIDQFIVEKGNKKRVD